MRARWVLHIPSRDLPGEGMAIVATWWPGRYYLVSTVRFDSSKPENRLIKSLKLGVSYAETAFGPDTYLTQVFRCSKTGTVLSFDDPLYERRYSDVSQAHAGHKEVVDLLKRGQLKFGRVVESEVSAGSIGESFADAVFTTHTRLQPNIPEAGVPSARIFEELIYLDTFVFEQAVKQIFIEEVLRQRILNAYVARLTFGHLKKPADSFQSAYDERRSSYGLGWCTPPNRQASMYVAGEICRRCESFHNELLMFFATQVPRSYSTALQLLTKTKTEKKIV